MPEHPPDQYVAFGRQPALTDHDVAYVSSTFRPQSEAERERAAIGLAPKPAYVLPDGTRMAIAVPDDELAAPSDHEDLRRRFKQRWLSAGGRPEDLEAELAAWLDGVYGVCLPSPCPETILAKDGIAQSITALLARPMPQAHWWRETLRHAVAAYDALVLPFASSDPERFGKATSRQRLVDAVRSQWPELFAVQSVVTTGHGA